jgi:hypothetical protein
MKANEFYSALGIKRSTYFKYKDIGMPTDDLDAAKLWMADRMALTDQGSQVITIGGRMFDAQAILDARGQLYEEQALKTKAQRKLAEYELQKKKGFLVERSELSEAMNAVLEPLAKALKSFPNKLAPLVSEQKPEQAYKILENEIEKLFADLQKFKKNVEE